MMGQRANGQGQFFYAFDLDKVVPADHLVREIAGILDLDWVHKELAPYYSHTGRPSIHPVLMIRMQPQREFCNTFPPTTDSCWTSRNVADVPIAAVSRCSKWARYSITSSAVASNEGGTIRPRSFAVLTFTIILNLVGVCTGRLPGSSPVKMRAT